MKRQRNEYTTTPRGTHAIIITELCKKFQTSKRDTLISDNLNMTINNKEITVLLGHNGAGKTTMMNMIMGRDSISIRFLGHPMHMLILFQDWYQRIRAR